MLFSLNVYTLKTLLKIYRLSYRTSKKIKLSFIRINNSKNINIINIVR